MTRPHILLTVEENHYQYAKVVCAICRVSRSIPRDSLFPHEAADVVREFAVTHQDCEPIQRRPDHVDVDAWLSQQL